MCHNISADVLGGFLLNKSHQLWTVPTDISGADALALKAIYDATAGESWSDNTNWGQTETANDWYGVTVGGGRVTTLDLNANNLNGSVASWTMPTAVVTLYLHANVNLSGDISSWVLPSSLGSFLAYSTSISGDVSGWVLPSSLIYFYVHLTSVSGDISSWVLPASALNFYISSTSINGTPVFTSAVALKDFQYQSCGLSQADVDANVLGLYNRRASFTYATPVANIGGTNSAPSGIYQDGDPPTTGKEYIYELVNDPESEGFNQWTITYTA